MPPETKYFRNDRCLVTNARAVLDGVTYAMANITSVRLVEVEPNRVGPVLLGGLGIAMVCGGTANGKWGMALLGASLIAGAVFVWCVQKPTYVVVLGTAGHETHAQSSRDGDEIKAIVRAISKAIIERG
ncbi:QacE-like protein OS=Shewanella baltica (strain OS195) GN=Sbal195_0796 PE=4 SV=1 [Gemmataceae bacterium]|nr:QacE-like protein OS=Shewanella baltica (strain OS195) GN=Sbal195_0796 PE=4 SV=1 [Gemmataceae bacterium]VTT98944.1 QacE-like protein OS=Shewanella baltica (strain OS195) GN=Sbal195_0796 PE=4 SV=1 [Gemmataceae bacterium]